jgi:hypothetical protein
MANNNSEIVITSYKLNRKLTAKNDESMDRVRRSFKRSASRELDLSDADEVLMRIGSHDISA